MPLQTLISYIYHWPWPCRRIPHCVWWCSPGWPTPDSGSQDSGTSGSFLVPRKCWRCRSKCDLCHPARSLGADFSTIGIIQICLYLLIVYVHSLMALYKNFEIDETYDEMIVEIFFFILRQNWINFIRMKNSNISEIHRGCSLRSSNLADHVSFWAFTEF